MDFMKEYEKWLASPALSDAERAELESIRNDPKEIESRFYGPLEFGTAGLRGIMAVGLHNMNIHVIRWATQGFAQVICAEGEEGKRRGVAICMDCRNHSMEFARAAAGGLRRQRHPCADLRVPAPHAGAELRRAGVRLPGGHQRHRQPQPQGVQRLQGLLGGRRPAAPSPRRRHRRCSGTDRRLQLASERMDFDEAVKAGLIETMRGGDGPRSLWPTSLP